MITGLTLVRPATKKLIRPSATIEANSSTTSSNSNNNSNNKNSNSNNNNNNNKRSTKANYDIHVTSSIIWNRLCLYILKVSFKKW